MHELNSSTYLEIEVKYDADKLSLPYFREYIDRNHSPEWVNIGSDDVYFSKNLDEFIRYRHRPERGELTIKRKVGSSNFMRTEVNLAATGNTVDGVTSFCKLLGYTHDFTIYKSCAIADLGPVTVVYYTVFSKDRQTELNRFLEIEANDKFCQENNIDCAAVVHKYEDMFRGNLIRYDAKPIQESIFELYTNRR
jgi:hypothetical protein